MEYAHNWKYLLFTLLSLVFSFFNKPVIHLVIHLFIYSTIIICLGGTELGPGSTDLFHVNIELHW